MSSSENSRSSESDSDLDRLDPEYFLDLEARGEREPRRSDREGAAFHVPVPFDDLGALAKRDEEDLTDRHRPPGPSVWERMAQLNVNEQDREQKRQRKRNTDPPPALFKRLRKQLADRHLELDPPLPIQEDPAPPPEKVVLFEMNSPPPPDLEMAEPEDPAPLPVRPEDEPPSQLLGPVSLERQTRRFRVHRSQFDRDRDHLQEDQDQADELLELGASCLTRGSTSDLDYYVFSRRGISFTSSRDVYIFPSDFAPPRGRLIRRYTPHARVAQKIGVVEWTEWDRQLELHSLLSTLKERAGRINPMKKGEVKRVSGGAGPVETMAASMLSYAYRGTIRSLTVEIAWQSVGSIFDR